jgi:hypothetical protein
MLQIEPIQRVVSIAIFCCAILASGTVRGISNVNISELTSQLEMTQKDLFGTASWTAENVSILDFRLGMTRAEANENSKRQNLNLNCVDYCDVCDQKMALCDGIGLHFGSDDRVESITVMRPLSEAPEDLREFSITRQFRGQTYALFHGYSNSLRLKLLGLEDRKVEDPKLRATRYIYAHRGLEVYVSLSANRRIGESQADLTITFEHPDKS